MTTIVNLKKEPYDIYIGRAGHGKEGYFGNPFPVTIGREKCLEEYRKYFYNRLKIDPIFKESILTLKDKVLGCFCKPNKACHGDIIAEYLDNL